MKLFYCLQALLWPVLQLCAQSSVTGVVHSRTHAPLSNVSVSLSRSGTHTVTSASGVFSLSLLQPEDTLLLSSVGYAPYGLPVTGRSGFLDISLEERSGQLDSVVVIGYGTTTGRTNTGSIAVISGADIEKQPVSNPLAALEGRVPGLSVTQSNGVPGSSFAVQIRGQNSLFQGSDPFFVIDGVPYAPNNGSVNQLSSAAASFSSGLSPFSSLNPADIESITVLKDADATAIYGSRGANGVILITTKKGKSGKTHFSLNVNTGVSRVAHPVRLLSTPQYIAMRREALRNDSVAADATNAPDLLLWDTTRHTDFQQLLTGGTAVTTDVQASLSGGGEGTTFLISGAFHRETTVFPGDMRDKRGSLNASINHTSPNRKLSLSLSVIYSSENNSLVGTDPTSQTRLPPNTPALTDSTGALVWSKDGVTINNPLSYLLQTYRAVTDNGLANLNLSYHLLPGLTLRVTGGYNTYRLSEVNVNPIASQNPQYSPQGYTLFGSNAYTGWIVEPQAEWEKTRGKLKLNALGGGTLQQNKNESSSLFAYGYTNDELLQSLSGASSISVLGNGASQYKYAALFGRVTASWDNMYILNLSGRRDGSSRFGRGRQFANFGAAGGAWIFSNEAFIHRHLHFLSFGKLRGSYGVTGNDQIGDYNYLDTWSPTSYPYNGVSGLYPTRLYNPLYSWETNRKVEGGMELGFLENRLSLTLDYYRNRSSDQLVNSPLPSQTGFSSLLENLPALVQNTGWEVSLTTKNIVRPLFSWTSTVTLTVPRNKLVEFPGLSSSPYTDKYVVGKPVTIVKGFSYSGVDPATGVFSFRDVNHDGVLDDNDFVVLADLAPKGYGGLLNSFSGKGWEVDIFLQAKQQTGLNELSSLYTPSLPPPGGMINEPAAVVTRWQEVGGVTGIQKFTATPGSPAYNALNYLSSSGAVYSDASFIRLKNVALSYSLPSRMLTKAHAAGVRIYVQAQNLFTLTHYKGSDPETQNLFSLPPLRTITCGIQLNL